MRMGQRGAKPKKPLHISNKQSCLPQTFTKQICHPAEQSKPGPLTFYTDFTAVFRSVNKNVLKAHMPYPKFVSHFHIFIQTNQ